MKYNHRSLPKAYFLGISVFALGLTVFFVGSGHYAYFKQVQQEMVSIEHYRTLASQDPKCMKLKENQGPCMIQAYEKLIQGKTWTASGETLHMAALSMFAMRMNKTHTLSCGLNAREIAMVHLVKKSLARMKQAPDAGLAFDHYSKLRFYKQMERVMMQYSRRTIASHSFKEPACASVKKLLNK